MNHAPEARAAAGVDARACPGRWLPALRFRFATVSLCLGLSQSAGGAAMREAVRNAIKSAP